MAVRIRRTHFGADHAVGDIAFLFDMVAFERTGEAGPPASAVEFVERREQRFARDDIDVDTRSMAVVEFVLERTLGAALLGHPELLGGEPGEGFRGLAVVGHGDLQGNEDRGLRARRRGPLHRSSHNEGRRHGCNRTPLPPANHSPPHTLQELTQSAMPSWHVPEASPTASAPTTTAVGRRRWGEGPGAKAGRVAQAATSSTQAWPACCNSSRAEAGPQVPAS